MYNSLKWRPTRRQAFSIENYHPLQIKNLHTQWRTIAHPQCQIQDRHNQLRLVLTYKSRGPLLSPEKILNL